MFARLAKKFPKGCWEEEEDEAGSRHVFWSSPSNFLVTDSVCRRGMGHPGSTSGAGKSNYRVRFTLGYVS